MGETLKTMILSDTFWLIVSLCFSMIVLCATTVFAVFYHRKNSRAKHIFSSLHILTFGVFAAGVLLLVPLHYASDSFYDDFAYVRPFLLSVHNALRLFILDDDFSFIQKEIVTYPVAVQVWYTLYAVMLYIAAPLLTFGNVLSLFKNITNEIRYHSIWKFNRPFYIMSELNAKSLSLAKSIAKKSPKAVIVFTDVFEKNSEKDYELLTEAYGLNAICFKKDITHLNIHTKKGNVELFLIGEDEAENVSQAVKITAELERRNKKQNVKIFVFAQKSSSALILNSLRYDHLLSYAASKDYNDRSFKLRRIDEVRQLVWKTIQTMQLFKIASDNGNELSILIVGMGSYGMEFFKTLSWYCQFADIRLRITVIDKQIDGQNGEHSVRRKLERDCPELLKKSSHFQHDEEGYDIEFYEGVDMTTAAFEDMITYEGDDERCCAVRERLTSTQVAIVSLGDDDVNVETAVYLREMFDRVHGVVASDSTTEDQETVKIYAIVYDQYKAGILNRSAQQDVHGRFALTDHRNVPYHICVIGSLTEQFAYDNIYDKQLEADAYHHHIGWVEIEEKIYRERQERGEIDGRQNGKPYFEIAKTPKRQAMMRKQYERYEYYRQSSIAKELYRRAVESNPILKEAVSCLKTPRRQMCDCENCCRRRKSEHMRWNAFMRVYGYRYHDGIRADRAKLHNSLMAWEDLPLYEQMKDDFLYPSDFVDSLPEQY